MRYILRKRYGRSERNRGYHIQWPEDSHRDPSNPGRRRSPIYLINDASIGADAETEQPA